MKRLIAFWKKDILNKLILAAALSLIFGVFGLVYLVVSMPEGKSLQGAFAEIFPQSATPTADLSAVLTGVAEKATAKAAEVTSTPIPTSTPFPTARAEVPTPLPEPTATVTPEIALGAGCIPNNPPQTGTVIEVDDGNTIRVLIEGLVYQVRYIGISVPPSNDRNSLISSRVNGELVFARPVTLYRDVNDKDEQGRLLRYVMVGDTFVNLELIKLGVASAADQPPNSACASVFSTAK